MSISQAKTIWQTPPQSARVGQVASETTSQDVKQRRGARSHDLRDRKRTRTRLMIQTEAFRLFAEKGYERTTVEEIADAAAISPRTFFRYFPSKEDVVLWDEWDPLTPALLEARPPEEPLIESFRAVIRETLDSLYRRDPDRLLLRFRLAASVPEVRARFLDAQTQGIDELAELFAAKRGAPVDDLALRIAASALLTTISVAADIWQSGGGKADLLELFDDAINALAAVARDLWPSLQPQALDP
jgi:AcrR family transcriptional regulator